MSTITTASIASAHGQKSKKQIISGGHNHYSPIQNKTPIDCHMWLEDENGRVAFDPDFQEYEFVKSVRKLSGRKQYKAYDGEKAKETLATVQEMVKVRMESVTEIGMMTKKDFWARFRSNPVHGCCFINALAFWKKNKHLKIKIGSMGWKKSGRGQVFWEYGDGLKGN